MTVQRSAGAGKAPVTTTARAGTPQAFQSGAAARQRSEKARSQFDEAQEARGKGLDLTQINRYRFRLREGEQADVVVLDGSLDDAIFTDEHSMWDNASKTNIFEFCPKEYDHCCLCDGIDRNSSSYTMFLTVLDLRGFTRSDHTSEPHIKRLMAVKNNIHSEFFKLFDIAMKEHGTIRGMHLLMARDGTIQNATGHPVMHPSGRMFEFLSEDDIQNEFGHDELRAEPEVEGQEGRLLKAENYDVTAFDYRRIFEQPTGEKLRRKYGAGSTPAGAREEVDGASFSGVRTRMNNDPNASAPRVRTRSQLSGGVPDPAPAATGPVAPGSSGTVPPRTRTRTAQPAAPAAPASSVSSTGARTRTRTAAPAAPTTTAVPAATARTRTRNAVAPANATVPNDLDPEEPF